MIISHIAVLAIVAQFAWRSHKVPIGPPGSNYDVCLLGSAHRSLLADSDLSSRPLDSGNGRGTASAPIVNIVLKGQLILPVDMLDAGSCSLSEGILAD